MVQKVWISGLCYRRRNDIEFNLGVGFLGNDVEFNVGVGFLGNDVEFNVGVGLGNDIEFNVGVGLGDLLRWGKGSKKRRCTATANVKNTFVFPKGKGHAYRYRGTGIWVLSTLVLQAANIRGRECVRGPCDLCLFVTQERFY